MIKGHSAAPTRASSAVGPHRNYLEKTLKGEPIHGNTTTPMGRAPLPHAPTGGGISAGRPLQSHSPGRSNPSVPAGPAAGNVTGTRRDSDGIPDRISIVPMQGIGIRPGYSTGSAPRGDSRLQPAGMSISAPGGNRLENASLSALQKLTDSPLSISSVRAHHPPGERTHHPPGEQSVNPAGSSHPPPPGSLPTSLPGIRPSLTPHHTPSVNPSHAPLTRAPPPVEGNRLVEDMAQVTVSIQELVNKVVDTRSLDEENTQDPQPNLVTRVLERVDASESRNIPTNQTKDEIDESANQHKENVAGSSDQSKLPEESPNNIKEANMSTNQIEVNKNVSVAEKELKNEDNEKSRNEETLADNEKNEKKELCKDGDMNPEQHSKTEKKSETNVSEKTAGTAKTYLAYSTAPKPGGQVDVSSWQAKAAQKQFSIDEYDEFSDTEEEKDSGTRSDSDTVFSPPGTPARRASQSLGNSPAPPSIPASPRPPSPSILGAPKCAPSEPIENKESTGGAPNGDGANNNKQDVRDGENKSQENTISTDVKEGSEVESKPDSPSSINSGAQKDKQTDATADASQSQAPGSEVTGSGSKVTESSSGGVSHVQVKSDPVKGSESCDKSKTAEKLTKKLSDSEIKSQVDGPSDFLDHSLTSSDSSDESFSIETGQKCKTRKQFANQKDARTSLLKEVHSSSFVARKKSGRAELSETNGQIGIKGKTWRENGVASDLHASANLLGCESGNDEESLCDSATDCAINTCNESLDDSAELGECDDCSTDEDCEDLDEMSSDKDSVKSGHVFRCPRYSRLQARMSYSAPNSPAAATSPARDRLTSDDLALTTQGHGHVIRKRKIGPRSRSQRKDSGGYNSDSVTMEPTRKLRKLKVRLEDIGKNPDFSKYMNSKRQSVK